MRLGELLFLKILSLGDRILHVLLEVHLEMALLLTTALLGGLDLSSSRQEHPKD